MFYSRGDDFFQIANVYECPDSCNSVHSSVWGIDCQDPHDPNTSGSASLEVMRRNRLTSSTDALAAGYSIQDQACFNFNKLGGRENDPTGCAWAYSYVADQDRNFYAQHEVMGYLEKDTCVKRDFWTACSRMSIEDQLYGLAFASETDQDLCMAVTCARRWSEVEDALAESCTAADRAMKMFSAEVPAAWASSGTGNSSFVAAALCTGAAVAETFAGSWTSVPTSTAQPALTGGGVGANQGANVFEVSTGGSFNAAAISTYSGGLVAGAKYKVTVTQTVVVQGSNIDVQATNGGTTTDCWGGITVIANNATNLFGTTPGSGAQAMITLTAAQLGDLVITLTPAGTATAGTFQISIEIDPVATAAIASAAAAPVADAGDAFTSSGGVSVSVVMNGQLNTSTTDVNFPLASMNAANKYSLTCSRTSSGGGAGDVTLTLDMGGVTVGNQNFVAGSTGDLSETVILPPGQPSAALIVTLTANGNLSFTDGGTYLLTLKEHALETAFVAEGKDHAVDLFINVRVTNGHPKALDTILRVRFTVAYAFHEPSALHTWNTRSSVAASGVISSGVIGDAPEGGNLISEDTSVVT
jgi:hypothetical protein